MESVHQETIHLLDGGIAAIYRNVRGNGSLG